MSSTGNAEAWMSAIRHQEVLLVISGEVSAGTSLQVMIHASNSGGGVVMRMLKAIFVTMLCAAAAIAQANSAAAGPTFIHCGTLIDGKSGQGRKNVFLEIDGDKIGATPAAAPGSAKVIDLSNETCLPGLLDTHTHILLNGDIAAEDYDFQLLKQSPDART